MGSLSKRTIQRLAVLHTLSLWRRGAYGPVRLHKTLFFADKNSPDPAWRLFTFKKWKLGQYSDEIDAALNDLQVLGRVSTVFDGPSERIRAHVPPSMRPRIAAFFADYFPQWSAALKPAFKECAHLHKVDLIHPAHQDSTHASVNHGDTIFWSFSAKEVEFDELDEDVAERLSDLVDVRFHEALRKRVAQAAGRPRKHEDWRRIYFGEKTVCA
ncbi:MAG TPA: hypothetical protein VGX78_08585 [Pirellulales bacterium]|jgi:hypothetical protein|nr:hypothetical protein [Pirellulales bacterium]